MESIDKSIDEGFTDEKDEIFEDPVENDSRSYLTYDLSWWSRIVGKIHWIHKWILCKN